MRTRGLAVGYGRVRVLERLTLDLERGSCWLLHGPNGSGKTTLLRTLAGLLRPLDGEIDPAPGMRLAYVPADTAMRTSLPLRLDEVVLMGAYRRRPLGIGWPAPVRAEAEALMREGGLWEVRRQAFSRSSSGQKQRALLCRAVMGRPDLLLMDEPTSNLDAESVAYFMGLLTRLRQDGVGMLISTHAHSQFEGLRPRVLEVQGRSLVEA